MTEMFNELPDYLLYPNEGSYEIVAVCDYCDSEVYRGDTVVEDTVLEEIYCDESCAKLATMQRLRKKVME